MLPSPVAIGLGILPTDNGNVVFAKEAETMCCRSRL